MDIWSVYIVECVDGSLYTGISNSVERRIQQHNQGKGASYTRTRRPVKILYSESVYSHSVALKREAQIKKMSRTKKINLIESCRAIG